jgi:hypothetical protein
MGGPVHLLKDLFTPGTLKVSFSPTNFSAWSGSKPAGYISISENKNGDNYKGYGLDITSTD